MTEIQNNTEILYKTPSLTIFNCRKIFHTIQKCQTETLQEWFNRIQMAIVGCDFGQLGDFLVIDKFMSGLSDSIFEKFSPSAELAVDELLAIAFSDGSFHDQSCVGVKLEPINDSNEFLSLDLVKTNAISVRFFIL